MILNPEAFEHYVAAFNHHDQERVVNHIGNQRAWGWMRENIPWFECPDGEIEELYYFRWWVYRKHIKTTPDGFVITEFLPPVPWADKHNTINCAAGHHYYEGRWLKNSRYLEDYSSFWFRKGGKPRHYSFWAADSLYALYLVKHDLAFVTDLLPDIMRNYEAWEQSNRGANGLFWQQDALDGMEVSIGGHGYRPTINSYMYGDAMAISRIAHLAGEDGVAGRYRGKAEEVKCLVQERLWDDEARFFKVLRMGDEGQEQGLADVRELHGYVPWYFNLPDAGFEAAWQQLMDPDGFYAPFGPTTAERRHPRFMFEFDHECLWNGPSWPYATTQTLAALANLLNNYSQSYIGNRDYLDLLRIYTGSQRMRLPDGTVVPWIDENLHPDTGVWLARAIMHEWNRPDKQPDRGEHYNHSAYCDLIVTGLVGLRPRADNVVEVNPLVPNGVWEYFCLDGLSYHGHELTILYDSTGERYHRGAGLRILADGKEIGAAERICRMTANLPSDNSRKGVPSTSGGWVKSEYNPVLGADLGTCFEPTLMHEGGRYVMWFSWRPKKSIAVVESADGVHWSDPVVLLEPSLGTGWEENVNRQTVVKREDGYHMWYTGQVSTGERAGRSAIGYATSPDGIQWKRFGDQPVLVPDEPWERSSVMCPHVMWDADMGLYRMWYSGGEIYEPDAIGYATSADGVHWTKPPGNPIFTPDPTCHWERAKVTACQVMKHRDWHLMFYIGFRDIDHAQIGLARSRDGIGGWQRHPSNPIISPSEGEWDHDATYKPFALFHEEEKVWRLWYNGRRGQSEQIGMASHVGEDLGF
jgi:hypothetical protein